MLVAWLIPVLIGLHVRTLQGWQPSLFKFVLLLICTKSSFYHNADRSWDAIALAHSSFPLDNPLASEREYLVQGRAFSNTSNLPADLSSTLRHGRRNGNVNQLLASPLALPGHNVFGYTALQSTLQDAT